MYSTAASIVNRHSSIAYASGVFLFIIAALQRTFSLPTPRTVLKPDLFLELELSHKFPISNNTAMLGTDVIRSYTPITDDTTAGHVDLIIKSYANGNISQHVSTLKIGQSIKFRGPKGAFRYTPNMARRIGMIAGGTGITPMLQIARAIFRGRPFGDRTTVDLIYANETFADILLKEELDQIARDDKNFHIYYVLNKPPANWTGHIGFVSRELIKDQLPAAADDVKILLCGPPPMIRAMKSHTESLGFNKARPVSKLEDQVFCF
ncbi:hypothetical protein LCI18_012863 [Fusarium solani-melongenae]|uniref:Uncharacterized protein n=1 Tax=Fusarium solani subsp. cucurbitae TaxID=2747967 RepID=A0ACD3ZPA0_FUSSC|nr:hypothetical protein LCI18_012863 [Fusarium solani-melongenae]